MVENDPLDGFEHPLYIPGSDPADQLLNPIKSDISHPTNKRRNHYSFVICCMTGAKTMSCMILF